MECSSFEPYSIKDGHQLYHLIRYIYTRKREHAQIKVSALRILSGTGEVPGFQGLVLHQTAVSSPSLQSLVHCDAMSACTRGKLWQHHARWRSTISCQSSRWVRPLTWLSEPFCLDWRQQSAGWTITMRLQAMAMHCWWCLCMEQSSYKPELHMTCILDSSPWWHGLHWSLCMGQLQERIVAIIVRPDRIAEQLLESWGSLAYMPSRWSQSKLFLFQDWVLCCPNTWAHTFAACSNKQ